MPIAAMLKNSVSSMLQTTYLRFLLMTSSPSTSV